MKEYEKKKKAAKKDQDIGEPPVAPEEPPAL